jgi:putative Ca2+/H+ antiporter (TMEM165/GDT1 family)
MNLAVFFVTFGLMIVAELPDKTMIATIVLSSKNRPLPVWTGAVSAFAVHCLVAVLAGKAIELLPHAIVESVVAALFAAGAVYLLVTKEEQSELEGVEEAIEGGVEGTTKFLRIAATSFGVIAVGEFGDLTQILVANLAARYHQPVTVFVGALSGLACISAVGVAGGRALLKVLPLRAIRKGAGVLLGGLALYSAVSAIAR